MTGVLDLLHLKTLGIKLIFTTIILLSVFGIFESFAVSSILLMSLIVTCTLYIIGDLLILPNYRNFIVALIEFGLAFIAVWALAAALAGPSVPIVLASAGAAYFFTFCEIIFHVYVKDKILLKKQAEIIPFPYSKLQTELSEEMYQKSADEQQEKE